MRLMYSTAATLLLLLTAEAHALPAVVITNEECHDQCAADFINTRDGCRSEYDTCAARYAEGGFSTLPEYDQPYDTCITVASGDLLLCDNRCDYGQPF